MEVIPDAHIAMPQGYTAAAIHAGLKRKRKDLCIIKSAVPAKCSAKFTKNVIKAAPVLVGIDTLKKSNNMVQALIVNSGNANAGTGRKGIEDVYETISLVAPKIDVPENLILAASTGIIGHFLPMDKMRHGIEKLAHLLSKEGGRDCAEAILTTDTTEKAFGVTLKIGKKVVTFCGITKGSGMIHPNMATTLAFVTTDAEIEHALLHALFTEAIDHTYHCITVDGHTSTNDTALIMANGMAGNECVRPNTEEAEAVRRALYHLLLSMAKSIVKDGEGATKFVTITVKNADCAANAKKMAFGIAHSPLVKTALFGQDANWGRILSAAGMVDVEFNPEKVELKINDKFIYQHGNPMNLSTEEKRQLMAPADLQVELSINNGCESAVVYTSDLSYQYIKINAEYHT